MSELGLIQEKTFLALRKDFVLKVDDNKPILYPLDFLESSFFVITPIQAFAVSLLTGQHELYEVEGKFHRFFLEAAPDAFRTIIAGIDSQVKSNPTQSGIGKNGAFERSDQPIETAHQHDPRKFIIDTDAYNNATDDIRRRRRLKLPISILAVPTHRCQTRCVYCYAERSNVPEMPLSRWRELIREMQELGIQLISLDNGDVFARKDGIDFIEALLEYKMHFLLSTKCLVTREHVERLVSGGFTERLHDILDRKVQLSIDALDGAVIARMVGSHTFLDNIVRSFDNFMAFGIRPKIKAVMTPINVTQPKKLIEFFYERGARRFQFVKYTRSFYRHHDNLFLDEKSIAIIKGQLDDMRNKYPDIDLSDNMDIIDPDSPETSTSDKRQIWYKRSGCGGGWSMLGISADGSAFLCEQMKVNDKYCVGDLRKQSIQEVWNSKRMFNFIHPPRESFSGTICYACEEYEQCKWEKGCCYRNAYFSYGSIYDAPPLCPKQVKPGLRMS